MFSFKLTQEKIVLVTLSLVAIMLFNLQYLMGFTSYKNIATLALSSLILLLVALLLILSNNRILKGVILLISIIIALISIATLFIFICFDVCRPNTGIRIGLVLTSIVVYNGVFIWSFFKKDERM